MAHISAGQAYSQVNHPPVTIGILHQIPMSYAMDAGGLHRDIGKDGIVGTGFKGTPGGFASGDGFHMGKLGAALRYHEIVPPADGIQMRGLSRPPPCACP